MTSVSGAGGAGGIQVNWEPIKEAEVPASMANHVQGVQESFAERIADLREQIGDATNPQQKLQLEQELMKLESAFREFGAELRGLSEKLDSVPSFASNAINDSKVRELVGDLVTEFRDQLAASYAEFGTACVPAEIVVATATFDAIEPESMGADTDVEAADTPAVPETGDGPSVSELLEMFESDPDAFAAHMSELSAEERGATMMAVQNELQQINQLFSMMSQFSQAMHDTSKAVIQNLRV